MSDKVHYKAGFIKLYILNKRLKAVAAMAEAKKRQKSEFSFVFFFFYLFRN